MESTSVSHHRAGFTLLEAVIVLVVLGIMTSVVIWRSGPAVTRAKVARAASVVAADLQYAQAMAARQRKPVAVVVTTATQAYVIRDAATATVFRERYLGANTDYGVESMTVTPSSTLEILPNGMPKQTTNFTVTLQGAQREVKITRAGQIRIVKP